MDEYLGIVIIFVLGGALVGGLIVLASTLGPKMPTAVKMSPFECGEDPFALPRGHLSVKFYLTAILFILFDVELVFVYPWAVVYRTLGTTGLVEIVIFMGGLMAGYYYAWDNGALEWQ